MKEMYNIYTTDDTVKTLDLIATNSAFRNVNERY